MRKRRLDLGLLQRELAEQLGVTESTVTNWELNRTQPALQLLPRVVHLLGRAPEMAGASIGEHLLTYRRERGLSQARLARLLGVDPATMSRWERGLRMPTGRYARMVLTFWHKVAPV